MINVEKGKSKKIKENKAITLIALVVTIVVLIILAGISISALTGDNSIINQAKVAKEDTEIASWEEQIDLAIIDAEKKHRNPTLEDVKEELKNKGVIDDYSQVSEKGVITTNEPVYEILGKLDDYIEKTFEPGIIAEKNETYTDKNTDTAIIPAGFMIIPGCDVIKEGLVISDNPTDTEVDSSNIVALGNQFVWIPVTNNHPISNKKEDNYIGILYEFSNEDSVITTVFSEPIAVESDNTYKITQSILQDDYNDMALSVENNKGFYVGRYELGIEIDTNKPVSKNANKNENIRTANASDNTSSEEVGVGKWYGLYDKCKKFSQKNENKSVVSSMIWGSQYDAMMYFMQINGAGELINKTDPKNETRITGKEPNDCIKNVFDLYGCHAEWTLEGHLNGFRVSRGSYWSGSIPPSSRDDYFIYPTSSSNAYSSRITLYIN